MPKKIREKEGIGHIDEEELIRAFVRFQSFPAEKQTFALAFLNGMEFQRSLNEAGNSVAERT